MANMGNGDNGGNGGKESWLPIMPRIIPQPKTHEEGFFPVSQVFQPVPPISDLSNRADGEALSLVVPVILPSRLRCTRRIIHVRHSRARQVGQAHLVGFSLAETPVFGYNVGM